MGKPAVSIIMPVYNSENYLTETIGSVLRQTMEDFELILVDDGSTDGVCPELCDRLAQEHPELICVIHQENRGLGGARNTGLEAARGEYLLFVDSDDALETDALEEEMQRIQDINN